MSREAPRTDLWEPVGEIPAGYPTQWMARQFPAVKFERYVDDGVVHCTSQQQARLMLAAIGARMPRSG